jgi:hypothetical protein
MSVRTQVETITPQKALRWLEKAARNRHVCDSHVRRLAEAIENGEWELNGETIKFDTQGRLQDGQHRLHAVRQANRPIKSFVTTGLSDDVFDTIDMGRARKTSDLFARDNEPSYVQLAGAVGWLWGFKRGLIPSSSRMTPRYSQAAETLAENPRIRESLTIGKRCAKLASPSMATALHYLFSEKDATDADAFFSGLVNGEHIARDDPETSAVYMLRNVLQENRSSKAKLHPMHIFPMFIVAWNAYRKRAKVRSIKWDPAEGLPTIL